MEKLKTYEVKGQIFIEVLPGMAPSCINVNSRLLCFSKEDAITRALIQVGGKQTSYTLEAIELNK